MHIDLKTGFNGKRVFVTGHTGFKGSWLIALLHHLGADVTGYALAPETTPSMFAKIGGDRLCRSVIGDLCDRESLSRAFKAAEPDFVLHLAAQSLVRRSYREPVATFDSNVSGTINLLETVRLAGRPCVVTVVTTDKVYAEISDGRPYVESDKLGGYDPYSTSKACCELICDSYRKSFFPPSSFKTHGVSIATARAGNVIGGGDWCEDRLLPDVVRAMSAGERVRIRNPRSVRPWQHVLEPLIGYLRLALHQKNSPETYSEAFNFGPAIEDALPVEQVVRLALDAWGTGDYFIDEDPHAPHESALLRLDSSKAHDHLQWHPKWRAAEAITKTVEWYRHADDHPLMFTLKQIREYLP